MIMMTMNNIALRSRFFRKRDLFCRSSTNEKFGAWWWLRMKNKKKNMLVANFLSWTYIFVFVVNRTKIDANSFMGLMQYSTVKTVMRDQSSGSNQTCK